MTDTGRLYDCPNCGTVLMHRTVLVESEKMENTGVRRCSECFARVILQ